MEVLRISSKLLLAAAVMILAGVSGSLFGANRAPTPAEAISVGQGHPAQAPAPPARAAYATRTAADVLAGLAKDPFWINQKSQAAVQGPLYDPRVATGTIGAPILVRGLRAGSENGWLVPVLGPDGRPVAAIAVSQDKNDQGLVTAMRGWPYASIPAVSEVDARAKATLPTEAVTAAVLTWSDDLGRPSDLLSPFWRVTNSSGNSVFVFESGATAPGKDFGVK